jgi:hypothetical protein
VTLKTNRSNLLKDKIGTKNEIVVESIKTGEPKGYEMSGQQRPKTDAEIRYQQRKHPNSISLKRSVAIIPTLILLLFQMRKTSTRIGICSFGERAA